jgi:DNA modification methylase
MKHPTQKPMELTKRLILSRISGGKGKILIPFAGSGSECIVAKQMGIEWLGIELNSQYVNFAKKWMSQCTD